MTSSSSSTFLPTPSTPSFQASELLINFILTSILSLPVHEYDNVLENKIFILLKHRKLCSLHRNVKLSIAILIVGAQRTDYFFTAFELMCAWSFLDGPHWIIQEELIRHAIISQFDQILENEHTYCLFEEEKREVKCSFDDEVMILQEYCVKLHYLSNC